MSNFQAYCPYCEKTVTTISVLRGDNLKAALDADGEVKVACFPRDHQWNLIKSEKENLRKAIADGLVR